MWNGQHSTDRKVESMGFKSSRRGFPDFEFIGLRLRSAQEEKTVLRLHRADHTWTSHPDRFAVNVPLKTISFHQPLTWEITT